MTLVPRIERRWVCIAQRGQTLLAAQLSSHFNEPNTYLPVFFFYAADRPREITPEGGDGYYSQVLVQRAANKISNCLTYIQPGKIILLGLLETAQSYLRAVLPEEKLVVVNTEEELLALPFISRQEPVKCKPNQPIQGLAAAKAARRPLIFDQNAPVLPDRQTRGKAGLIVLENNEDVDEVVAVNYAAAIDADLAIVEPIDRRELHSLAGRLAAWANDHSSPALKDTRRKVLDRVKGIDFSRYEFATFFTAGLPYGLILENRIPFTHMQNGPYCGLVMTHTIVEEHLPPTGSALLFSLQEFDDDETDDVARSLNDNNFVITALLGEGASNENFDKYGAHLPYDLLHICSHGGQTDGYFLKKAFTDREGNNHAAEFFEVVSFAPSLEPDVLSVERKVIFATLDGIPWSEEPLGRYPAYVGDDFMKAVFDDNRDVRTPVDIPIALSCHIKCHGSFHQGAFDHVAGFAHPVVFNNSCSSSHELATAFLFAGARAYLATLWKIGSTTAKNAALEFYKAVLSGQTLLEGFVAMTRSIRADEYKDNYIFWGLHFSRLRRPPALSDQAILAGLIAAFEIWMEKLKNTKEGDAQNRIKAIVLFLQHEISRRLPPERLKRTLGDAPEIERSTEPEAVPREIILRKEIKKR